jgi:type VI secretion system protein ImpL
VSVFWVLLIVLVVLVAALVALVLVRRRNAQKQAKAAEEGKPNVAAEVRKHFDMGKSALVGKVPDRKARDQMPSYLLIGEPGSGKTALLGGSGLYVPLVPGKDPLPGDTSIVNLWMIGRALVADVAGRLLYGDGGSPAPDDGFRAVLDGLERLRPERPIDGIIVAVSAAEVAPSPTARNAERKRKAGILRNAVALVQQSLGMNVPVYIVVTQCDRLSGFRSLAAEVGPMSQGDVLGWSSPYPPFTEQPEDWIDEALREVRKALVRQQGRRFATGPAVRSPDDFFLFPSEISSLGEGMRNYVDPIFIESAGQETVTPRGIYFCGADARLPAPALLGPDGKLALPDSNLGPREYKVYFARDVFDRKIFPERALGKPATLAVQKRSRIILALQIAACCLGGAFLAGLWIDASRVERRTTAALPFLREVAADLRQITSEEGDPGVTLETRSARAVALLGELEGMENGRLRSPLNPASWWSRLDGRIENAMLAGYDRVLFDAYRAGLSRKVADLLRPVVPISETTFPPAVDKSQEFARLEVWLADLSTFETNVVRHDGLLEYDGSEGAADVRAQSVSGLSEYILGYKISPTLAIDYYRSVLVRGARRQRFDLNPHREPAVGKATHLFGDLYRRLLDTYSDAVVRAHVQALLTGLNDLEGKGAEYKSDDLWALRDAIGLVEKDLSASALVWISTDALPPNAEITRLLGVVQRSKLLGPDLESILREQGKSKLKDLKDHLASAGTNLSGPLLERKDGVVQLKLSPFIVALKPPIDTLRQQTFMTTKEDTLLTPEMNDVRVSWDVEVLKEAERLPKEYEALAQESTLKTLDTRVRNTVSDLTARQVKTNTLGAVARAARTAAPLPSSDSRMVDTIRTDAQNLGQASIPIRSMINTFGRVRMDDARDRLRELLRGQGGRLLSTSARILDREGLYGVRNGTFTWWDGESTPAFKAFDVADLARLSEYATAQRARADVLTKELAEPLLGIMESPEVSADPESTPGMGLWQGVVSPLSDYENKKAGNSVSALESFLLTDLPQITLENCLSELDKQGASASSGDYFTAKRKRIRGLLREQCSALSAEDMRSRYASIRRTFNRDLSGKFPFVKIEPGIRVEDAPPEAVRRFLLASTEFRGRYQYLLKKRGDAPSVEVLRYLDKLDAVRAFMMPMWAQADSAEDGIFDIKVEFRVNPTLEVGGNRIAEWAMRLADERLYRDGPKAEASWRVNDPVRVELRWAKSSLDVPLPTQAPNVVVNDRTVIFEERGPWALLRMIAFHQTSSKDPSGKPDGSGSHVLGFVIQSSPDPTGGFVERVGADTNTVRVFIRVGVTGVEKDKLLRYPEFPAVAPNL